MPSISVSAEDELLAKAASASAVAAEETLDRYIQHYKQVILSVDYVDEHLLHASPECFRVLRTRASLGLSRVSQR